MFKYINNVGSMVGLAITAVIGGFSDLVGRVARAANFLPQSHHSSHFLM